MSVRSKVGIIVTLVILTGALSAFAYFGGNDDRSNSSAKSKSQNSPSQNEDLQKKARDYEYSIKLVVSEACEGAQGENITVRKPCQVLLTAMPVTQDPDVAVAFFETTGGGMNPLFIDSEANYTHGFAVDKENNGEHSYIAQIVSKNDRSGVKALSNSVQVQVKIVNRGCGNDDGNANIPDANLKKALLEEIKAEFGGNPQEVDCTVLQSIKKLNAARKNIHNLEGLQYAIELSSLNLAYNPLISLDPLGTLEKLTYLNLTNVGQRDFGIVPGNSLRELYVGDNEINSLAFFGHFQNLSILSAFSNNISDIAPVLNRNNLSSFAVYGNPLNYSSGSQSSKNIKGLRDRGVDVLADDITLSLTTRDGNQVSLEAGDQIMLRGEADFSAIAKQSGIKIRKIEIFEEKGGRRSLIRTLEAAPFQHLLEFPDDASSGIYRYIAKITLNDASFRETTESELVTITVKEKSKNLSCQTKRVTCGVDRDMFSGEITSRWCRLVNVLDKCAMTILDCTDGVCVTKPDNTPFSFAGCPKLQQQMIPTGAETQTYDVALPADQTCGTENFCQYIMLCPRI